MLLLLLRVGRTTDHPIDEVRRVQRVSEPGYEDLAQILEDKRREFHSEARRVWSAAGGKVSRTHCRRAWDDFIDRIKPVIEVLYPSTMGGKADWNPDELGRQINRFPKLHKDIADRWDAKYRDRHTMDRTAESITTKAAEINDLYRKTKAAESDHKARTVSDDDLARRTELFLADPPGPDTFEECCRRLILRHIEHRTGAEPRTGLTADDLLAFPALLSCIAGDLDLPSGTSGVEVIPFTSVVAPAAAAAVMLQPVKPTPLLTLGEKLVDRLAGLLLPLRRFDLLAPLTPASLRPTRRR